MQDSLSPQIRIAALDDLVRIQDFIRANWKSGHVFARDDRILRWQHRDRLVDRLNFVIAEDAARQSLLGLLGFIPTSQFDPQLAREKDYWLALWKLRDDAESPGLGLQLLFYLLGELKPNTLSILGYTPQASAIYRSLCYVTGKMTQFFRLNAANKAFSIASVPAGYDISAHRAEDDAALDIVPVIAANIHELGDLFCASNVSRPKKSPAYLGNRYLSHPQYRYDMRAVRCGSRTLGCWVLRPIMRLEGTVLRGIDCVFDPNAGTTWMKPSIDRLLREYAAEYWDFYAMGHVSSLLNQAGFARRDGNEIVIPNYFEPFVRANIDILYAIKPPVDAHYGCVKGDADQDRPS
jgi:hypothetical protein